MKKSRRSYRGVTVAEALIVCFLVGLLSIVLFGAYRMGLVATHKGMGQNELFGDLQFAAARIQNALSQTTFDSVTVSADGRAVSCLSAYDEAGRPVISPDADPEWQAYLAFYHQPVSTTLFLRRLPIGAAHPFRQEPGPIERFDPGTGVQPLSAYLSSGQPLSPYIKGMNIAAHPTRARCYEVRLEGLKPREGNRIESRSNFGTTVTIKN